VTAESEGACGRDFLSDALSRRSKWPITAPQRHTTLSHDQAQLRSMATLGINQNFGCICPVFIYNVLPEHLHDPRPTVHPVRVCSCGGQPNAKFPLHFHRLFSAGPRFLAGTFFTTARASTDPPNNDPRRRLSLAKTCRPTRRLAFPLHWLRCHTR
jgi:hypothetical protein